MIHTKFEEFMQDAEHRRLYEQESLAFEATELICALMQEQETPKVDLAKKIGKSKSYVTQLLSGARNMTLHTLADVVFALGHKVELKTYPLAASPETVIIFRSQSHAPIKGMYRCKKVLHWGGQEEQIGVGPYSTLPSQGGGETAHAA